MKTTLYFTAGNSDKIYSAWLEEANGGDFNVLFEYGRRGSKLVQGSKTPIPVSRKLADDILARLLAEKRGKGYSEDAAGRPFDGEASKLAEALPHPRKEIVTLQTMRNFSRLDYSLTRKYDGEASSVKIGGAVIRTEFMRTLISGHRYTDSDREMFKRWPGGWHAALTVMELHGENVLQYSTQERDRFMASLVPHFTPDIILAESVTDVEATMASGAEGICAVDLSAPFGSMFVVKGFWEGVCEVAESPGSSQSVAICDPVTKQPRGRCTLSGGKIDRVKQGSLIKVLGMCLTDDGKVREPRVDNTSGGDSWLKQF